MIQKIIVRRRVRTMLGIRREKMNEPETEERKEEGRILIWDLGTSRCKYAVFEPIPSTNRETFCHEVSRKVKTIPTIIGRNPNNGDTYLIGDDALEHKSTMNISWIKEEAIPKDMKDYKDFAKMFVDKIGNIKEVVLNCPVDYPTKYKEDLKRILRPLGVERIQFISEPVAVVNRLGKEMIEKGEGLVLDSGDGSSDVVCVGLNEKNMLTEIQHTHFSTPLAGGDITMQMIKLLWDEFGFQAGVIDRSGPNFSYCMDLKEELLADKEVSIEFANNGGRPVKISDRQKEKIIDVLFDPDFRAKGVRQILPIDKLISKSISNAPPEVRPKLFNNIILTGGTFADDFTFYYVSRRLKEIFSNHNVKIQRPPRSETAVIEGMYVLRMAEYVREIQESKKKKVVIE